MQIHRSKKWRRDFFSLSLKTYFEKRLDKRPALILNAFFNIDPCCEFLRWSLFAKGESVSVSEEERECESE